MLTFKTTASYRKDLKRVLKRGLKMERLEELIETLVEEKPLDQKHLDHELKGHYAGFRECHIQPDWLLIYDKDEENILLTAIRTGSHSDLF